MAEHLFIVSRQQPDLYKYMAREFSSEQGVQVIVDRRQGHRRLTGERRAGERGDRRQTDRRAQREIPSQVHSFGYAFVRLSSPEPVLLS